MAAKGLWASRCAFEKNLSFVKLHLPQRRTSRKELEKFIQAVDSLPRYTFGDSCEKVLYDGELASIAEMAQDIYSVMPAMCIADRRVASKQNSMIWKCAYVACSLGSTSQLQRLRDSGVRFTSRDVNKLCKQCMRTGAFNTHDLMATMTLSAE